jgi:hypothetical protein
MRGLMLAALVLVAGGSLVALSWRDHAATARALLERWAAHDGLTLRSAEFRWMRRGPFWWAANHQAVFRVVVTDGAGRQRRGWVRLGGWLRGLRADAVKVRWDSDLRSSPGR